MLISLNRLNCVQPPLVVNINLMVGDIDIMVGDIDIMVGDIDIMVLNIMLWYTLLIVFIEQ